MSNLQKILIKYLALQPQDQSDEYIEPIPGNIVLAAS